MQHGMNTCNISSFFDNSYNNMRYFRTFSTFLCLIVAGLTMLPTIALAAPSEVSVQGSTPPPGMALPWPVAASLSMPTDRYPHNVLGSIPAFTTLTVSAKVCDDCSQPRIGIRITLDAPLVFEDVAPRLWDVTGDGRPEIVVVQSHEKHGARLTVWTLGMTAAGTPDLTLLASTGFIGTRFRWLAPFGIGDFTGDGKVEIAYVETPHLGKTLRLVGLDGDRLRERAALRGVTNHRIGEETIAGSVRDCAGRVEAVLATGDWQRIVAVSWQDGRLVSRDLGALQGRRDLEKAMICDK